jgi:thiamine-phosphate pyrophosphorylase
VREKDSPGEGGSAAGGVPDAGPVALRAALLVVSDGEGAPERVLALGRAAAAGGAWGFLVREPGLGGRVLLELADRLRDELAPGGTRLLVSDRADVALASGAFGVELGERSLPVGRVRSWVGERLRLGRSVHDAAGARAASRAGADWLVFGHVFDTAAKRGLAPAGLAGLRAAIEASACPVLAIGGIDAARVPGVIGQGAAGVAVIGAVARAGDPGRAVRELVAALAAAVGGPGREAGAEVESREARARPGGSGCGKSSS